MKAKFTIYLQYDCVGWSMYFRNSKYSFASESRAYIGTVVLCSLLCSGTSEGLLHVLVIKYN